MIAPEAEKLKEITDGYRPWRLGSLSDLQNALNVGTSPYTTLDEYPLKVGSEVSSPTVSVSASESSFGPEGVRFG